MQIMINLLKRKIADVFQLGFGSDIPGCHQLLFEVDFELNLNLAFFHLFIKQSDLLLRIGEGIVCDGEQFGMLADPFYILGSDFLAVTNTLLDKVGRVF